MKICTNITCKTELPLDAKFCSKCGSNTDLTESIGAKRSSTPPPPPPTRIIEDSKSKINSSEIEFYKKTTKHNDVLSIVNLENSQEFEKNQQINTKIIGTIILLVIAASLFYSLVPKTPSSQIVKNTPPSTQSNTINADNIIYTPKLSYQSENFAVMDTSLLPAQKSLNVSWTTSNDVSYACDKERIKNGGAPLGSVVSCSFWTADNRCTIITKSNPQLIDIGYSFALCFSTGSFTTSLKNFDPNSPDYSPVLKNTTNRTITQNIYWNVNNSNQKSIETRCNGSSSPCVKLARDNCTLEMKRNTSLTALGAAVAACYNIKL